MKKGFGLSLRSLIHTPNQFTYSQKSWTDHIGNEGFRLGCMGFGVSHPEMNLVLVLGL